MPFDSIYIEALWQNVYKTISKSTLIKILSYTNYPEDTLLYKCCSYSSEQNDGNYYNQYHSCKVQMLSIMGMCLLLSILGLRLQYFLQLPTISSNPLSSLPFFETAICSLKLQFVSPQKKSGCSLIIYLPRRLCLTTCTSQQKKSWVGNCK